jgi:hypothetical protein
MYKLMVEMIMQLFNIHRLKESDNCPLNSLQAKYIIELSEGNTLRIRKLEKLAYITIGIIVMFGSTNLVSSVSDTKPTIQLTEVLASLEHFNNTYCSTDNKSTRELLIGVIKEKFPSYPNDGLCGVEHKLIDIISSRHL